MTMCKQYQTMRKTQMIDLKKWDLTWLTPAPVGWPR